MLRANCVLPAMVACVALVRAQEAPIIRAEAREVLIDVTVTGRKGPVASGDLTAKDFSVWEDGRQQKITGVSSPAGDLRSGPAGDLRSGPPGDLRSGPPGDLRSGSAADPEAQQKHFVIYFDFGAMPVDDRVASEKAAAGFIDGLGSPDRYMAVVNMGPSGPQVLQNFTTAKAALKKAVDVPVSERTQPNTLSGATVPMTTVCDSMAPAQGRKALLFFTGGAGLLKVESFKPVLTACNRANVAIYVIPSGAPVGMNSQSGRPPMAPGRGLITQDFDPQPNSAFAQYLADGTGGEVLTIAETLPAQLAAIAREQDDYYRIAYVPPPAKEGSCHSIKVSMNAHGLGTLARNEYCTEKPVDLVAGKIAGQALEARAAGATGTLNVSALLPYFYTGTNRASVRLSADVVPAGMKFEKDKTGLHGQLDIVASVLRPDGGTAARFADTVDIEQESQQSADAFMRAPYHYEHLFTVAAGSYTVQLAIGAGPNAVGKIEIPLKVEPWNASGLGISGVAFSTEARALDGVGQSGAPVLEGHGPLVAGGKQFVPAATNKFARSGQMYFYTEIYDAALGAGISRAPGRKV